MTRALIRTLPWHEERYARAGELLAELHVQGVQVALVEDSTRDAMDTFEQALDLQGDDDCWHFEDDVVLTSHWARKARALELANRGRIVQAWSRRQDDLTVGSRRQPGSTFISTLCFYVPGLLAPALRAYSTDWRRDWTRETSKYSKPFTDILIADFLKQAGLTYWLHVPSLVQHVDVKSTLGNPAGRVSLTFVP